MRRMPETFRDIIDLFPRKQRAALLERWNRKLPRGGEKIFSHDLSLWRHRNSIPGWAWAAFAAASEELDQPVTIERLTKADIASREERKQRRAAVGQAA